MIVFIKWSYYQSALHQHLKTIYSEKTRVLPTSSKLQSRSSGHHQLTLALLPLLLPDLAFTPLQSLSICLSLQLDDHYIETQRLMIFFPYTSLKRKDATTSPIAQWLCAVNRESDLAHQLWLESQPLQPEKHAGHKYVHTRA